VKKTQPFKHSIRCFVLTVLAPVLFSQDPCAAKGLPKDLGVRMAKIYAGEGGQAGFRKTVKPEANLKKPKITADAATLKLSTERIELSELLARIKNPMASAEPDKTAKLSLEHSSITIKIAGDKAATL